MAQDNTDEPSKAAKPPKAAKSLDSDFVKTLTGLAGLIGVASLLYVFGFVIVNIHLASKGIRDFELTRPTYISAGTVFIVVTSSLVLLTVFASIRISANLRKVTKNWKAIRITTFRKVTVNWRKVIEVIAVIMFLMILYLYFFILLRLTPVPEYIVLVVLVTFLVSILIRSFSKEYFPIHGDSLIVWGVSSVSIIIVLFIFAHTWARLIYPKLSPEFGGGRPVSVKLVIQQGVDPILFTEAKIEFESVYRTEELDLIDVTEKTLIVENLSSRRNIKINRDLIAEIIFPPEPEFILFRVPTPVEPIVSPTPTSTPALTPTPLPTSKPTLTPTPVPPDTLPESGFGGTPSVPPVISGLTIIGLLLKGFHSVKKRPTRFTDR